MARFIIRAVVDAADRRAVIRWLTGKVCQAHKPQLARPATVVEVVEAAAPAGKAVRS